MGLSNIFRQTHIFMSIKFLSILHIHLGNFLDVLADDVKFEVDPVPYPERVEVGDFIRVRDDGDAETAGFGVADREADTIDRHRALLNGDVALRGVVFYCVITASVGVLNVGAYTGLVYVSLDDMAVKERIWLHTPL